MYACSVDVITCTATQCYSFASTVLCQWSLFGHFRDIRYVHFCLYEMLSLILLNYLRYGLVGVSFEPLLFVSVYEEYLKKNYGCIFLVISVHHEW